MDVNDQRRVWSKRGEKRPVLRGVSEDHVLRDRTTDIGEIGEQGHERNRRIYFVNPISDLETVLNEDGMLGLRVNKDGKLSTNQHRNLRHRRDVDPLTSSKDRAGVACLLGLILIRDLGLLYLDLLGTHRRFIWAEDSYGTAIRLHHPFHKTDRLHVRVEEGCLDDECGIEGGSDDEEHT